MPTYEYRCDNCAKNFDVVQSFHDDPLTECPTCGSPVRKVFGSVGIVFKGSGFYKTDSRSGGSSGATESTVPAAAKSDGAPGSGSSSSDSSSPSSSGADKGSGSSDSKAPAATPAAPATSPGSSGSGSSGSGSSGSGSGSSGSSN